MPSVPTSVSFSQLFWPRGRIDRGTYWVFGSLSSGALRILQWQIPNPVDSLVFIVIFLVAMYMVVCVIIGRLHDINLRGWWALPIALSIILLVSARDAGPELNQFFQGRDALAWAIGGVLLAIGLGGGLYVGLMPSTPGTNRFGPSPYAVSD